MSTVYLNKLTKRYGEAVVVPELTFEIHQNECISLLGPSGCGKTTVLRMIAGLEEPSDGKIQLDDLVVFDRAQSIYIPPEKRNLGMVFQSYAIWPHLTVFENVTFPLKLRKVPKEERYSRTLDALKKVQLGGYEKRRPHQLSGGQQQRVALARALVARPRVLLLDEPLSNLDANLREEMCQEIASLRRDFPMTMIYVTHDQSEAFSLSDRIAVMNKGRIEQVGPPKELRTAPKTEFVRKFLKLNSNS